jgi:RsiW-degrading membrane proteinase PrsW (M82 family)
LELGFSLELGCWDLEFKKMNPLAIIPGIFLVAFVMYVLWLVYAVATSPIPLPYNFKSVFVRWR